MSRGPRIIPLTAVAIGGVLAINAIIHGPDLLSAAKAFAEDAAKPDGKAGPKPAVAPGASVAAPVVAAAKPAAACAPTAAELAKEAGLSPAELQVLQSLGNRRGQLDQREADLDTQVQLIAAAEAKLDARIKEMNGLKGDIQGLLSQADQQQEAETGRLIRVYEAMNPKDAAPRLASMEDAVRLPIAAKMKERVLAAILGKMDPEAARILTEKLAHRIDASQSVANARNALNPQPTPATAPAKTAQAATPPADLAPEVGGDAATDAAKPQAAAPKAAAPKPHRVAKSRPKLRQKPTEVASSRPASETAAPVAKPASPAPSTTGASAPAKSG